MDLVTLTYRIGPDNGYAPFPLLTPNPPDFNADTGSVLPLHFPVLPPVEMLLLRLL